jgi:hypothetical protein
LSLLGRRILSHGTGGTSGADGVNIGSKKRLHSWQQKEKNIVSTEFSVLKQEPQEHPCDQRSFDAVEIVARVAQKQSGCQMNEFEFEEWEADNAVALDQ